MFFKKTFKFLQPHVTEKPKDSLPFMEQFFLTLVRLRMDIPFEMLAGLTGVSETTARAYFWKWIDVGFAKLRFLDSWPDREALLETLPAAVKVRYRRLTSIIDCFENFHWAAVKPECKSTGVLTLQEAPNSKVCPSVYTIRCNLLCLTCMGWTCLGCWVGTQVRLHFTYTAPSRRPNPCGHWGFTLQDDFAVICSAELIIPAFTKGKPQLSPADVEGTRDIANIRIRIHVWTCYRAT